MGESDEYQTHVENDDWHDRVDGSRIDGMRTGGAPK